MLLKIVSIFDTAIEAYSQPQFVASLGGFQRSFADEVNRVDPQNGLNAHPEHMILYHLGEFDDGTGKFELFDTPRQLAHAVDLKR